MTLSAWQATVQDEDGNIVPSAEISVLIESSGLAATIYSTRGGAALSNPFFADANGFAQFYANKGEYRITANSGVFSNTFRYVRIGDAGGYDVQTSTTDATAGRVMTVGAFGLGAEQPPTISSEALMDATIVEGSYNLSGFADGHLRVWAKGPIRTEQTRRLIGGGTTAVTIEDRFSLDGGSTWSAWQRVDPQAFGFGEGTTSVVNLNTEFTVSQKYISSSSSNKPSGETEGGMLMVTRAGGGDVQQMFLTNPSGRFYTRCGDDAAITAGSVGWQPVYTGANYQPQSINPLNAPRLIKNLSGSTIFPGGTALGQALGRVVYRGTAFINGGPLLTDSVWMNVGGNSMLNNDIMEMVRIS